MKNRIKCWWNNFITRGFYRGFRYALELHYYPVMEFIGKNPAINKKVNFDDICPLGKEYSYLIIKCLKELNQYEQK